MVHYLYICNQELEDDVTVGLHNTQFNHDEEVLSNCMIASIIVQSKEPVTFSVVINCTIPNVPDFQARDLSSTQGPGFLIK